MAASPQLSALCAAAGLREPKDPDACDPAFLARLPVIRGLLEMQRASLIVVWVDTDVIRWSPNQPDLVRRRMTWDAAERLVNEWRKARTQ